MLTAAALVALLPASVGAAAGLATITAGGDAVVWQPQVAGYDRLVLTVAGPGGTVTREFHRGESPSFSLFDAGGGLLADGAYKWELRVVPYLDDATREALVRDREAGSTATADALRAAGVIPAATYEAGTFSVVDGALVMPGDFQEATSASGGMTSQGGGAMTPLPASGVLTNSDGVIRNSLCVGFDCPDSPTFSDSTILLMENNTRIKFGDTSVSPFPNNDWEIEANSSLSGGASYLGFNDCGAADNDGGCANDLVFAVEAGARQSALYVESDGDVGIGTSNPVLELHIVRGDSPGIRLEQDGSSGFAPQTWDMAGNETNFFVRDVTGGSKLSFRIRPGAPNSSIDIAADGDVGMGTAAPASSLHVTRSDGTAKLTVEETNATAAQRTLLELKNKGRVDFSFNDTANGIWSFSNANNATQFIITKTGSGVNEMVLDTGGQVTFAGVVRANGGAATLPDYVFEPNYELMPLDELSKFVAERKHLPNVPSRQEVEADGGFINMTQMQYQLLEKIEELTLYTIDQHQKLSGLEAENSQLRARLESLEQAVGSAPATTPE